MKSQVPMQASEVVTTKDVPTQAAQEESEEPRQAIFPKGSQDLPQEWLGARPPLEPAAPQVKLKALERLKMRAEQKELAAAEGAEVEVTIGPFEQVDCELALLQSGNMDKRKEKKEKKKGQKKEKEKQDKKGKMWE